MKELENTAATLFDDFTVDPVASQRFMIGEQLKCTISAFPARCLQAFTLPGKERLLDSTGGKGTVDGLRTENICKVLKPPLNVLPLSNGGSPVEFIYGAYRHRIEFTK